LRLHCIIRLLERQPSEFLHVNTQVRD
jgi:hypothetical protein